MTQAYRQLLRVWRERLRDQLEEHTTLLRGGFPEKDGRILLLAEMAGNVAVIKQMQDLDYAGFVSSLEG